ncbi:MAG: hypothetical protein JOY62_08660 [Acidobacteriaceae bacterium]|nr:hypothetical protein [Acidobacteriaceae bacterium]MBV9780032.1 hypothetical protein [Acidobacteriaceae bacterium]
MQLTDAQVMTLVIAIIVPLSLLIYSNSRITEAKDTLRAEIQALRAEMKAALERIENMLKIHELEHHR